MDQKRFEQQLSFILEVDKEKNIFRQTHLSGHGRRENDAGDTYAYDEKGLETQHEREQKAAARMFGLLPDDQREELMALFTEYDACETPEARFVRVMDNFQPLLLNNSNGGEDWKRHKVSKSQVVGRQRTSGLGSEAIWDYTKGIIDNNVRKGNIRDE